MLFLYFLLTFFFIVRLALPITIVKTKHFSPKVTHPSLLSPTPSSQSPAPKSLQSYLLPLLFSVPYIQLPIPIALSFSMFCQYISMKIFQHTDTLKELYSEYICVHHWDVTTNILLYLLFHIAVCPSILFLSMLFLLCLFLHSSDHHTLALSLDLLFSVTSSIHP